VTSCPHCGAVQEPGREYCLDCGRPLRGPTRRQAFATRYGGNAVLPLLGVLLLAAVGALVAIAVSRGDDGMRTLVATNPPARTTVAKRPIFRTDTVTTTAPPVVTTAAPPAATGTPRATSLTEWTVPDGYTLVLASIPQSNGRASAVEIAKRALAQGLTEVGVLDSKEFTGLHPGYFVVFSGIYQTNGEAATHIGQAETAGFAAPYARRVTR
jgi:hypothetical protein